MPQIVDILLVLLTVALSAAYLIWRKIRSARRLARDWSTGRAEACDHCPAITVRQAQRKTTT